MAKQSKQTSVKAAGGKLTVVSVKPGNSSDDIRWTTYMDWLEKKEEGWDFSGMETVVLLEIPDHIRDEYKKARLPGAVRPLVEELLKADKNVVVVAPSTQTLHHDAASRLGFFVESQRSPVQQNVIVASGSATPNASAALGALRGQLGYTKGYRTTWRISASSDLGADMTPVCVLDQTEEPVIVTLRGRRGTLTLVSCDKLDLDAMTVRELCGFIDAARPVRLLIDIRPDPNCTEGGGAHRHFASILVHGDERRHIALRENESRVLLAILSRKEGPFAPKHLLSDKDEVSNLWSIISRLEKKISRESGKPFLIKEDGDNHKVSGFHLITFNPCPLANCILNAALYERYQA